MTADVERAASAIVQRLRQVAASDGGLEDAAEAVVAVTPRSAAVTDAARSLADAVEDELLRREIVRLIDLLVGSGLLGSDRPR